MAEIFLHELLQTSNSVQTDIQDRNCMICLQETGTMSRETGFIEIQLRLPCDHFVGSGCIAVWLQENNSCPLCRREFFPAQSRPDLEDSMMESQDDEYLEDDLVDEDSRSQLLQSICEDYCRQLDLDRMTIDIAERIIENLLGSYPYNEDVSNSYDDRAVEIVTLGIYMASRIAGNPRSSREICIVQDANGDCIRASTSINGNRVRVLYDMIWHKREQLIDEYIIQCLEGRDWRAPAQSRYEVIDAAIECDRDMRTMETRCVEFCARLQVHSPVDDLAQHIAASLILEGFRKFHCPYGSRYVSQPEIAAVSIYIASHLVGQPFARRAIQNLLEDEAPDIRSTYRVVRNGCNQLVEEAFRRTLDVPLRWETLEAGLLEEDIESGNEGFVEGETEEEEDSEAEAIQGETTIGAPASTTPRMQGSKDLSNLYCDRLIFAENEE